MEDTHVFFRSPDHTCTTTSGSGNVACSNTGKQAFLNWAIDQNWLGVMKSCIQLLGFYPNNGRSGPPQPLGPILSNPGRRGPQYKIEKPLPRFKQVVPTPPGGPCGAMLSVARQLSIGHDRGGPSHLESGSSSLLLHGTQRTLPWCPIVQRGVRRFWALRHASLATSGTAPAGRAAARVPAARGVPFNTC